jgi:hypothetical protein
MGFFSKTVEEDEDERGKVFTWAKDRRLWMHLSAFLLFSVIIHGSGFYLFKVVYPSPVRVKPDPDAIQVLESDDPAARALLQRLADRSIYLLPPSARSEVRLRLESGKIHFTPGFQRAGLDLLPPPSLEPGPGLVEPVAVTPPASSRADGRVFLKVDPALEERPIAPWSVLHDYLGLAEAIPAVRFAITIAPGGEVEVTGIEGRLEEPEKAELATVVESTLRFLPSSGTVTGWIELAVGVDPAP